MGSISSLGWFWPPHSCPQLTQETPGPGGLWDDPTALSQRRLRGAFPWKFSVRISGNPGSQLNTFLPEDTSAPLTLPGGPQPPARSPGMPLVSGTDVGVLCGSASRARTLYCGPTFQSQLRPLPQGTLGGCLSLSRRGASKGSRTNRGSAPATPGAPAWVLWPQSLCSCRGVSTIPEE